MNLRALVWITGIPLLVCSSPRSWAIVGPGDVIQRDSHVTTVVDALGGGGYRYNYTVWNDSPGPQWIWTEVEVWPAIVGYEVPLDHPSVVSSVTSPDTWTHRFLSAAEYELQYGAPNPFGSAYVLQWYDILHFQPQPKTWIVPEGFNARFNASEYEPKVGGFSFEAVLSPVDGPYAALWHDQERQIGDPPLPGGGPLGGGALPYKLIPEVPGAGLTALACLGLALVVRRRRG